MRRNTNFPPFELSSDWEGIREALSADLLQALAEKAEELGGEELREEVLAVSIEENGFVNPEGMRTLVERKPGIGMEIMDRMQEIGEERRAREFAQANSIKGRLKVFGRGVLRIFG